MPEDMVDLMWEIATQSFLRMVEPDAAPLPFGRFEALDTRIGEMGMVTNCSRREKLRPTLNE